MELLKEDYAKKNYNMKARKMQQAVDITQRTISDPMTNLRQIEKNKLISSSDKISLVENFTGDHKLNNFRKNSREKQRLQDFLMT